jgi:hypothetical protein
MDENTPRVKQAGTISVPLPKVSLKLGGKSPGSPRKEVSWLPWRAGRCPSSIPVVGLASNVALRYIRGARAGVPRTMSFLYTGPHPLLFLSRRRLAPDVP